MTKLHELNRHGQSIWYDNIRRALIDSGELQALLDARALRDAGRRIIRFDLGADVFGGLRELAGAL